MSVMTSLNVGADQEPMCQKPLPMSHNMVRTSGCGCKMSVPTLYDIGTTPRRLGKMSVAMSYDV
eukprot:7886218-Karenia_brevis.AAC.1